MKNVAIYLIVILYIAAPFIVAPILYKYNIHLSTNLSMILVVVWFSVAIILALLANRKK